MGCNVCVYVYNSSELCEISSFDGHEGVCLTGVVFFLHVKC